MRAAAVKLEEHEDQCTSSSSSNSGKKIATATKNSMNLKKRRWYDSGHECCRCCRCCCSCHMKKSAQDDAIHLVTTTTGAEMRAQESKHLCSRSKAIKLEESEEEDEGIMESDEQQEEEEQQQQHEEEEEEEEEHAVPVFIPLVHEEDSPSPASGIFDDVAAEDTAAPPEDDSLDVERFLNCDDDDPEIDPPRVNSNNNSVPATIDLEFLGFGCDRVQALCDEDFAIRKNNNASSSPAACDYGEVDDFLSIKVENHEKIRQEQQQQIDEDPFWKQMQHQHFQRRIWLRLDYEDVLNAWPIDRRPFISENPKMNANDSDHQLVRSSSGIRRNSKALPEDSTSDIAGSSDVGVVPELSSGSMGAQCVDQIHRVPVVSIQENHHGKNSQNHQNFQNLQNGEGREARVSRYREKRRTRLFSKKIRYEVRKLNAERRPRLKGRFVKRSPEGED